MDNVKYTRLNNVPLKSLVYSEHQNVILFGNRIFEDAISKLKWGHNWIRVGFILITAVLIKTENRNTWGLHVKRVAVLQWLQYKPRKAKDCSTYEKLKERHGRYSPSEPSERTAPANTLISDLQPPELWEN